MGEVDLSAQPFDAFLNQEWLATNGLGGFASSTIPGLNTRKYHGLLVAALSPPVRQMVLLARVEEVIISGGQTFPLSTCEYPGVIYPHGHQYLRAFSAEPFPRWAYQGPGWTIEKQLRLLPGENTVCLSYTLLAGDHTVELDFKPLLALRGIHELMYQWNGRLIVESTGGGNYRVPPTNRTPEVFFAHDGRFQNGAHWYLNSIYRREQQRGYAGLEDSWMPGSVRWKLAPGQTVHFVCSTDPIELDRVISETNREEPVLLAPASQPKPDTALALLVRAAAQFVVRDRDQATNLMSGYPWSSPSGRDAMIGFTGLLLVTGKLAEAQSMLQAYAARERRGLLPSEFPWDGSEPKYHSSDVSLWFVNAVWQYLRYGGDAEFVERVLRPVIESILRHYREGTDLGIRVDPEGLVVSREPGTPSTWMDAKAGDWVMTPRYGRAVEVNALWYNAQRIAAELARAAGQESASQQLLSQAALTQAAFNARFWNEDRQCCYDVVDEQSLDGALRPNQLFAISLPFPVLSFDRHSRVLDVVSKELLTPLGLRTLSPSHPSYTGVYAGGVVARDKAYHQGSAFPWLLGAYVTAFVRVGGRSNPVREQARQLLQASVDFMAAEGLGQLCELFDGDTPHRPGGLRASARSLGELLRCYTEDVLDLAPADGATFTAAASLAHFAAIPKGRAV